MEYKLKSKLNGAMCHLSWHMANQKLSYVTLAYKMEISLPIKLRYL